MKELRPGGWGAHSRRSSTFRCHASIEPLSARPEVCCPATAQVASLLHYLHPDACAQSGRPHGPVLNSQRAADSSVAGATYRGTRNHLFETLQCWPSIVRLFGAGVSFARTAPRCISGGGGLFDR